MVVMGVVASCYGIHLTRVIWPGYYGTWDSIAVLS